MDDARLEPGEHIFHIATVADWQAAQRSGSYDVSTLGRSLGEEGFIHASRRHQVDAVRTMFYAERGLRLQLLEIDPGLLGCELRLEVPAGGDEVFPHIYGPLPVGAVVAVHEIS